VTAFFVSVRDNPWFQRFVLGVIGVAAVLVGLETYPEIVERHGDLLHALDAIVLGIFVLEILIKLASYGRRPWRFFADGWNVFDFVIVAVCFFPGNAHFAAVLRLARVLRAFRLLSAVPRLQLLVAALLRSLPSMGYVAVLLALLFYVYGVLGVFLWAENDPKHFGDLPSALLSLFRVVTLEDWTDIMYTQMYGSDVYPAPALPDVQPLPKASPIVAPLYFVSFVLIGTMIVLNLMIGVVINSMTEAQKEADARTRPPGPDDPGAALDALEHRLEETLDQVRQMRVQGRRRVT
jgi:voltage-gated sodium channel